VLEFLNFTKAYPGGKTILKIDSLTLPAGLHWVQGKNGSGKSTLFRCIAGMSPFEGRISLNQTDSRKEPVVYRHLVNYSEAEPLFPGFLSGKEMLEFVADAKKSEKHQLEELIDAFQLALFFENPASTYSSGMAKKISLVMAFLGNPKLILLDEPFITIDQESVAVLSRLILGARQKGISFLVSSHPDFQNNGFETDQTWVLGQGKLTNIV
jgi:ABC-2 type transport system ATP-binding protein